jgi:CheY-like chemotaxis protein
MIGRSKILIVDDTPTAREVLEDLLTPQGYQLLIADNGLTALEKARSEKPDLILLDVMMPGVDGFEVCRQLRMDPITSKIPVIMITALSDQKARLKGIEVGADDFITKPINQHELRLRVNTITRLNRYRHLLTEQKKFEYVVNYARTGHIILNIQGQFLFANLQAQRFLNTRFDENTVPAGLSFQSLVQNGFRQEPAAAWKNWPGPAPENMPRYLIRPESKWLKTQWLKVDVLSYETDNGVNWLVTLEDVTHQVGEIRDMHTFQKMVSHKLRTPLVGLVTGLEIIGKWVNKLESTRLAELIEIAQQDVQRLNKQIEDVLKYSHIPVLALESGGFYLEQLPALVERIGLDLGVDTVYLRQPEEASTWCVKVSELMMEMVLFELLENARKFHPEQMPVVEIGVRQEGEFFVLTVSDNGRTLSLEELEQVWSPYYQIENAFTGEIPGMGLGLPTVASLVWQANGYCNIHNREQQVGITAEIRLPLLLEHNQGQPQDNNHSLTLKQLPAIRIL